MDIITEVKKRVGTVDFFKFVFSIIIVLYHAGGFYNTAKDGICVSGFIGVEFFFMVSGYLLTLKASRYKGGNLFDADLDMLKGKLLSIFPYMLLAVLASNAFAVIGAWSVEKLSYNLLFSLPELFDLQMVGFPLFAATGVSWYLSVLFFVSFLIYPLLCRRRELFTKYIAPLTAVWVIGYIAIRSGYLNDPGEWWDSFFKGMLRGYADIALGCVCFEITRWLNSEESSGSGGMLWPVLEVVSYAGVIAYAIFHGASDAHDFFMIPLVMLAVSISFSRRSILAKLFTGRVFNWLGIFSLSIYLSHYFVRENLPRILPELNRYQLLPIYLAIVAGLSLLNYGLGRLLSRLFTKGRHMLVAAALLTCVALLLAIPGPTRIRLEGEGTAKSPYLVESLADLKHLRNVVNNGNSMEGLYVLQTADIDMKGENWEPIGAFTGRSYFKGVYDGGNHTLENLCCYGSKDSDRGNVGLFGMLLGVVKNLGIESGHIEGKCVGAITSHAYGEDAKIINCYNKAEVVGSDRAGGICDYAGDGSLINCVNLGKVQSDGASQVLGYDAGYVAAIYPEQLPESFTGRLVSIPLDEGGVGHMLNSGIEQLLERGVLSPVDAGLWNED